MEASALVIAKGKQAAAHLMEASEGDIEFAQGRFTIAGTDRSIGIMELAQRVREGKMPEGVPLSLDVDHATKDTPSTFPNGCHVAEVEIDPETGVTRIVRYFAVNDFGTVVNPMIVAGQLHGGVAQGIGQALMEEVSYDSSGQPITGSFMDYALPRAEDIPPMEVGDHPSPAKSNPLGTKGCGEAGCAGSLVCIVNAVVDALSEYGITPYRHAADAGTGVARDPGCEGEGGVRIALARQQQSSSPRALRRGGRSSIPETSAIEPRSRGVLDSPPSRGMTGEIGRRPALYAAACSRGW